MPNAKHPAAELHVLLAVAEQAAKQAASFDTETKKALADGLDRIRVHVMAESDGTSAQPVAVPMWRLRQEAGSYYAGLILVPPTQEHETCGTCQGQRVVGTGKK